MSKREHVLQLLRAAGPRGVTTAEFLEDGQCGSRFGARVQELRDAGWSIDARRVRAGSHVYVLVREPPTAAPMTVQTATPADIATVEPQPLFELAPAAPANALCWDEAA